MAADLERPDEHEAGAAQEPYCWMPGNANRECTGECVAYDPRAASDPKLTKCMVLNSIRSVSANVTKLVQGTMFTPSPPPPHVIIPRDK